MLLWIRDINFDSSLDEAILETRWEAVSLLGEAGHRGKHLVLGPRPVLQALGSSPEITKKARAYYLAKAESLTQLGRVVATLSHVSISSDCSEPHLLDGKWIVPLSLFSDPDYLQTANVICEDEHDFDVLRGLAAIFARRLWPECGFSANSMPGGGRSTHRILRRVAESKGPVFLCAVDSDREHAGDTAKATAELCVAVGADSWRGELYVLKARELDNIIATTAKRCIPHLAAIEKAQNLEQLHPAIADYACLKTGESICRFHSLEAETPFGCLTRDGLSATARHVECARQCGLECRGIDCNPVPRFGTRLVAHFGDWLKAAHNLRTVPAVETWHPELLELVKRVFERGAASHILG